MRADWRSAGGGGFSEDEPQEFSAAKQKQPLVIVVIIITPPQSHAHSHHSPLTLEFTLRPPGGIEIRLRCESALSHRKAREAEEVKTISLSH